MMKPLENIIECLARRVDYILNHPPRTNRVGEDDVTVFDGKEYRNLTGRQVEDIRSGAYWGACRAWEDAVQYRIYLEYHFTPCADYYLRQMRKQLI